MRTRPTPPRAEPVCDEPADAGDWEIEEPKGPTHDGESVACDVILPFTPLYLRWLPDALQSVLTQRNIDECTVHLIGDGCDVPPEYFGIPGVRCYRNHTRVGPYVSLCRVFDACQAPFLAVQDADDVAAPLRIRRAVSEMLRTGADLYGAMTRQFVDADFGGTELESEHRRVPFELPFPRRIPNPTRVVRREAFEALGGFAGWRAGADVEFCRRAQAAGFHLCCDARAVGRRRLHSLSLSNSMTTGMLSRYRAAKKLELRRRRRKWKAGFDPRPFGCLDRERSSPQFVRLDG